MNLSERFMEFTANVREQAADAATRAASAAREGVTKAADQVESVKTPVETLADAGRTLSKLSHDAVTRLVSHQADVITGSLHDGAQRLRLLAKADSVRDAYVDQIAYLDVTRDRLTRDARTALTIVSESGRAVAELAATTYADLVRVPAPKPARKAASRAAGKSGRGTRSRSRKAA